MCGPVESPPLSGRRVVIMVPLRLWATQTASLLSVSSRGLLRMFYDLLFRFGFLWIYGGIYDETNAIQRYMLCVFSS